MNQLVVSFEEGVFHLFYIKPLL